MSKDLMHYDAIIEDALRSVVRRALNQVIDKGLPGDHHFYITFRTDHPDVKIPEFLTARYPDEMTIVLQYQFYDLKVDEEGFSVTLSFNNVPEPLAIPFAAIVVFADPSVNFALQFQPDDDEPDEEPNGKKPTEVKEKKPTGKSGEVVSLDQFRKK